jgi:hypothetical protein
LIRLAEQAAQNRKKRQEHKEAKAQHQGRNRSPPLIEVSGGGSTKEPLCKAQKEQTTKESSRQPYPLPKVFPTEPIPAERRVHSGWWGSSARIIQEQGQELSDERQCFVDDLLTTKQCEMRFDGRSLLMGIDGPTEHKEAKIIRFMGDPKKTFKVLLNDEDHICKNWMAGYTYDLEFKEGRRETYTIQHNGFSEMLPIWLDEPAITDNFIHWFIGISPRSNERFLFQDEHLWLKENIEPDSAEIKLLRLNMREIRKCSFGHPGSRNESLTNLLSRCLDGI